MKKTKIVLVIFIVSMLFGGCATIEKYSKMGMDAADKAAKNYVDKEMGEGTAEDYNKVKDDKEKMEMVLPYWVSYNKLCKENKITAEKRDEGKKLVEQYYNDYQAGKLTKEEFTKKCEAINLADEKAEEEKK